MPKCGLPGAGLRRLTPLSYVRSLRNEEVTMTPGRTKTTIAVFVLTAAATLGLFAQTQKTRQSLQDWPTGPYQVMANWPQPLPDTRHSHDGWTWGSFGSVYAETPDRIWIAMRGELPLPDGAKPWTPYAALNPSRGIAQPNTDGLSATCEPAP